MVTHVVKVLDVVFCTNVPLEEICHTDAMLEITPIGNESVSDTPSSSFIKQAIVSGDLTFQEDLCKVSYLNSTCKVCLKDLSNVPDAIPFFDDCGEISTEIAKISSSLESMNVEVCT